MRRLSTGALLVALFSLATLAGGGVATATTTRPQAKTPPAVQVVKVSGLLDPIVANFLTKSVADAARLRAPAIILRISSPGSVLEKSRLIALAQTVHDSKVPVIAWIGPSGARVEGGAAQLVAVANQVGIAPGSSIGNMGEMVIPKALWKPAFVTQFDSLKHGTMDADAAAQAHLTVTTKDALVLRRMLLKVPGFVPETKGSLQATPIQFAQLSTVENVMHTFASPAVAQLLFIFGLCLVLFELFTAGVGVAGLCGAAFLIFGCYGFGVLPVRPFAVALLILSIVAFAVDVQLGTPRIWTLIGAVLLAVGMVFLYDGLSVSWISSVIGYVAVVLFMYYAMPSMTRSRFSTPTISREFLIGQEGIVTKELADLGVIQIGDGLWPARTQDDTIAVGAPIKVVGIEGVICTVSTP